MPAFLKQGKKRGGEKGPCVDLLNKESAEIFQIRRKKGGREEKYFLSLSAGKRRGRKKKSSGLWPGVKKQAANSKRKKETTGCWRTGGTCVARSLNKTTRP